MDSLEISELVTTTLVNRTKKLANNVENNNALLRRLNEAENIEKVDGGRTLYQEISYDGNQTYRRYSGYDILDISPSNVLTSAFFDYKQAAQAVTMSGLEKIQNMGESEAINWSAARVKNAEMSFMNNISSDVYSTGAADGGKQIGGLQLLVSKTPTTGTVGGINRATWEFWRNKAYSATADGGAAATRDNIRMYMNRLWVQQCRGMDKPDLIVADNNFYSLFEESLQYIQRIQRVDKGMSGFSALAYKDAVVVLDGGRGGDAPTDTMYMLNTDYIHWKPHKDRNMVMEKKARVPVNQDAEVHLIMFAGNETISNCFTQGVLFA